MVGSCGLAWCLVSVGGNIACLIGIGSLLLLRRMRSG